MDVNLRVVVIIYKNMPGFHNVESSSSQHVHGKSTGVLEKPPIQRQTLETENVYQVAHEKTVVANMPHGQGMHISQKEGHLFKVRP